MNIFRKRLSDITESSGLLAGLERNRQALSDLSKAGVMRVKTQARNAEKAVVYRNRVKVRVPYKDSLVSHKRDYTSKKTTSTSSYNGTALYLHYPNYIGSMFGGTESTLLSAISTYLHNPQMNKLLYNTYRNGTNTIYNHLNPFSSGNYFNQYNPISKFYDFTK